MKLLHATLALFLLTLASLHAEPIFESQELFAESPNDKPNYRIPSIICVPNGDILAIVEKRNHGIGDVGNTDIALRRSSDLGRTWGPIEVIMDDGDDTCTDLTLCYDNDSNRLYVFFLRDKKRFVYIYSDDYGKTWSSIVDIHDQVTLPHWDKVGLVEGKDIDTSTDPESDAKASKVVRWKRNWVQRYGIGPGNAGIQLKFNKEHKGRLVIPARHREYDKEKKLVHYTHIFYSDDHGKTWQLGPTKIIKHGGENQLTELNDGTIMANARNEFGPFSPLNARRLVAISPDGGDTWTKVWHDEGLVSLRCHAAILTYNYKDSPHNGLVLFSNPANPMRQEKHPYGRYNMTVCWSTDNAATWSAGRPIRFYNSSYSDMTVLPDGSIGMIFEKGERGTPKYWASLDFVRFNLEWLMAPPRSKWPAEGVATSAKPTASKTSVAVPKEGNAEFKRRYLLAKQGNAAAQAYVGNRYDKGTDEVTKNPDEALRWFIAAASQDNQIGQQQAGARLYARKDYVQAYKWLSLAAKKGHANSRKMLKDVEKKLNSRQLAEAQKLVDEFTPAVIIPE